ncbi:hypothetical protein SGRIM128S_09421 [Streptomyces griseomycini]
MSRWPKTRGRVTDSPWSILLPLTPASVPEVSVTLPVGSMPYIPNFQATTRAIESIAARLGCALSKLPM